MSKPEDMTPEQIKEKAVLLANFMKANDIDPIQVIVLCTGFMKGGCAVIREHDEKQALQGMVLGSPEFVGTVVNKVKKDTDVVIGDLK